MQVGTATSVPNPNAFWLNSRGMWAGYIFSVVFLHLLVNCIPVLSVPLVWTITHIIHNVVRLIIFDNLCYIFLSSRVTTSCFII